MGPWFSQKCARESYRVRNNSQLYGTVRDRLGGSSEDPRQKPPVEIEARNTDRA